MHANNAKNLSNYFNRHARTHGYASAKDMQRRLVNAAGTKATPAPGPFASESGAFGGDGGFGDWQDRGHEDERFEDARDEPAQALDGPAAALGEPVAARKLVPLSVALSDADTRAALRGVEELWTAASERARAPIKTKSQTTMLGQGARALKLLALAADEPLPPRVQLLPKNATVAQINQFGVDCALALEDLVSIEEWARRLRGKAVGSMAVAMHMLHRLFQWATTKFEMRLASERGVGTHPPPQLVKARSVGVGVQEQV